MIGKLCLVTNGMRDDIQGRDCEAEFGTHYTFSYLRVGNSEVGS